MNRDKRTDSVILWPVNIDQHPDKLFIQATSIPVKNKERADTARSAEFDTPNRRLEIVEEETADRGRDSIESRTRKQKMV